MKNIVLPDIKFVSFKFSATEKDLIRYMNTRYEGIFLVYLRCRYKHEKQWEYITDACCLYNGDDILWMSDWHEGQEYVEYLGITQMR